MENNTGLNNFLSGIYKRMALGVALTALVSYLVMSTEIGNQVLQTVFSSKLYFYGIAAIEIGLLLFIQAMIHKISESKANILFFVYAALNGLTLTGIFLVYTGGVILTAFIASVVVFSTLALVGTKTGKDLTGWGSFLKVGMWGVFIVSIINIFIGSSMVDFIISIVAVLVFSGLTLFDAQVYKNYYLRSEEGQDLSKIQTLGALHMYVNFIMIFVSLLKIIGGRD